MELADLNSIIQTAAKGEQCPAGDLTDLHLHTCLTQLYADYNSGKYDVETCKKLKERLVDAWKSDKDAEARHEKAVKEWNDAIKRAELTGKQLHKAGTLREFAADAAIILELVIGETGLLQKVGDLQ